MPIMRPARPLLLLVNVALLATQLVSILAWRLPSPSRSMVGRQMPQSQSLPAALYSAPPPVELDGDGMGTEPLVAAPAGYEFVEYDGQALSRLATQQWWRVLARLNEVGLPILNWYALVRSDEVSPIRSLRMTHGGAGGGMDQRIVDESGV